eukprot:5920400-Prorocentrum_lima.AAC.1
MRPGPSSAAAAKEVEPSHTRAGGAAGGAAECLFHQRVTSLPPLCQQLAWSGTTMGPSDGST